MLVGILEYKGAICNQSACSSSRIYPDGIAKLFARRDSTMSKL